MADTATPDYRTKTEIILRALRGRIVSGELVPGQRLVLRPLGEEFACSDIPVREAMRSLAAEGLVAIVPHGSARVAELRANELIELTETRTLLEPQATVAAGAAMTAPALDRLFAHFDVMRAATDGRASADYGRLNREFHRLILAECPNRTLARLIDDLWSKAERGRAVHRLFQDHIAVSMSHHEEILRCLAARDLAGLRAIAEEHSAHGLAAVKRLVEEDARRAAIAGG